MTVGLAAAGIGGLMASGAWRPSRTLEALATAGAGVMLLTVARNENYVPGTVHIEGGDGRWFTQCPHSEGTYGAEYDSSGGGYDLPECRHTSFNSRLKVRVTTDQLHQRRAPIFCAAPAKTTSGSASGPPSLPGASAPQS